MFLQTPLTRVLFGRCRKAVGLLVLGVFFISVILASVLTGADPKPASAATNSNLNFQARLQTAAGAIVADGYYNVQFKLYDVSSAGTALWTETYYDSNGATSGNDNRVRVKNGYISVSLGSQTAFPAINWDQDLWLTMNIGGSAQTASPTYDGEMNPRLKLTGIPYAFKAGQLAQFNNATGFTSTLSLGAPTVGNQNFVIPDQGAAGTYNLLTTAAASAGYIQNTTSPQTANFNISGNGVAGGYIDATGGFKVNGTSGLSATTCSGGQLLQNAVVTGGIVTGGTCIAASSVAGVTTVGTFVNGTARTNGALISGNTITFGAADGTNPGMVSTGTQTFAGDKTFSSQLTTTGGIANNNAGISNVGSLAGVTSVQSAAATTLTIDSGTTGDLNLGTGANAKTINLGNATGGTNLNLYAGTGAISLTSNSGVNIKSTGANNANLYVDNTTAGNRSGLIFRDGGADKISFGKQTDNSFYAYDHTNNRDFMREAIDGTFLLQPIGGNVGIGATSAAYKLDVAGDINSSTGYRVGGTAGATTTCSGGQIMQNQVVQGGIVTGGTCVTPAAGGVTTVGAISGTSNANGATITGTTINLTPADGTNGGVLTNGAQTIAGAKTFNGGIVIAGGGINAGSLGISNAGAITGVSSLTTAAFVPLSITANAASTWQTTSGALTLTSAAAATWSTTAGNLTLNAGGGTIVMGANTTTLQKSGTAFTIDINNASNSTLTLTNAAAGTLNLSVEGSVTAASFSGNGASLTSLNASNLSSGTVGTSLLTGSYTGITGTGALTAGSINWSGAIATTGAISGASLNTTGDITVGGNLIANGNTTIGNATTDRLTITAQLLGGSPLVFQGATDNSFTTTLALVDPTANRTIALPNASGTVAVSASGALSLNATTGALSLDTVGISNGGTGATSFTTNGIVYSNGTNLTATAAGSTGQCLIGTTGSAPTWGTCGTASTLQDVYNSSGSTNPQIQLSGTNGGLKLRDASSTVGNLLQLQNSAGTVTYFAVTAGGLALQNSSGTTAMDFNNSTGRLRIYNPSDASKYADIYYDNAAGEAVFAANNGNTRIGNGSGNIVLTTTNAGDVASYTHTGTLSGASSANDFTVTQNLVAGSNALTGSVLRVEQLSSGTNITSSVLYLNTTSSTATLLTASLSGAEKFKVTSAGSVSIAAGQTVSSVSGSLGIASGSGALNLTAGGANSVIVKAGTDNASAFAVQNSGNNAILSVDTSGAATLFGKASSVLGKLTLYNASNANTVSIQSGTTSTSYTLTLPTAAPTVGQCLKGGASTATSLEWGGCGAASTSKTVTIVPEYPGAVMSALSGSGNYNGTLTSDFDDTGNHNYYSWKSAQATLQDYDIVVRTPIPNTYASGFGNLNIWMYADSTVATNTDVTVNVRKTSGGTTTSCGTANTSILATSASTWQQRSISVGACTFASDDILMLSFRMKSRNNLGVAIGEITYTYNN